MLDVEKTVMDYMPYARASAKRAADRYHLAYDDCFQEVVIGIILAARYFDDTRGYFGTYMKRVVSGRIWNLTRRELVNTFPVSFIPDADDEDNKYSYVNRVPYTEVGYDDTETMCDFAAFIETLDDDGKLLVDLFMSNMTRDDIAVVMGIPKTAVARLVRDIRARFRKDQGYATNR